MPPETTLEIIKRLAEEQLGVDQASVHESSSFESDLGADSLDAVEFVMAAEEEFGIEIDDEEAVKIVTVADAVKLIDELKAKQT